MRTVGKIKARTLSAIKKHVRKTPTRNLYSNNLRGVHFKKKRRGNLNSNNKRKRYSNNQMMGGNLVLLCATSLKNRNNLLLLPTNLKEK